MSPLILIIEDHALFRVGLSAAINTLNGVAIVDTASIEQAMHLDITPDIALIDVELHGMNGLDGIAVIKDKWPHTKIIMISAHASHANHQRALVSGAMAFLSKADSTDVILAAINDAMDAAGINNADRQHTEQLEQDDAPLSKRQLEVLHLLVKGLSNKAIGNALGISENTIRWHVRALLSTLNATSRTEAAFAATKLGLLT